MPRIPPSKDSRFPYLPGIDALRALAVLAVFLYHAGVSWVPGGFLGVDLFFVISGYLITALLLGDWRHGGQVRLGRFWLRRARRLLPAVGVLIAVTMIVAAVAEPDRIAQLRGDAIASLGYFANWHFAFAGQSYFDQFQRPSLFRHLWSLSVEEQFYLFWPLVFAAGMKLFGRRRLLLGVLAGALGSVALAWVLFDPGSDASRVYYGTDTHAVGLLAGVALALVWDPVALRRHPSGPLVGPALDVVGVAALAYVVSRFVVVHDYDLGLWHGGYLALAIVTALLLAALAHPAARLGSVLGSPPALWLGVRSYSFYLWHWPVLALTRPGIDVDLPRGILIPLQLAAVLVLADLSYRYVELPFRGRAPMPHLPKLPQIPLKLARPALTFSVLAIVAFIGWSGVFHGSNKQLAAAEASTPTTAVVRSRLSPPGGEASAGHSADRRPPDASPPGGPNESEQNTSQAAGFTDYPRIIALGDSVMIGAQDRLASRLGPGFSLSAKIGRQADEFVKIVQRLKRAGHRPDALIIQMGDNGPLYGDDMKAIQRASSEVGELFLVTDHAPVSWEGESNQALEEAAADWPHTTLIDWAPLAAAHEGLLWDGIHLSPAAAGLYARLVSRVVHETIPFPAKPEVSPARALVAST